MKSQNDRILSHLKLGNTITPLQALHWYKCWRLASRVRDIKNMGYTVHTEMVKRGGKRYARYSLGGK